MKKLVAFGAIVAALLWWFWPEGPHERDSENKRDATSPGNPATPAKSLPTALPNHTQAVPSGNTDRTTAAPFGMVRGHIRDMEQQPVEGATLVAGEVSATTDATGAYVFLPRELTTYRLEGVRGPGIVPQWLSATISAEPELMVENADIFVRRLASISGRVIEGPGAEVHVDTLPPGEPQTWKTTAGSDGSFSFDMRSVILMTPWVTLSAQLGDRVTKRPLDLYDESQVELRFGAQAEAHAAQAQKAQKTDAPEAHLVGTVRDRAGSPLGWFALDEHIFFDAKGRFDLTLLPGKHRVRAEAPGYAAETQLIDVQSPQTRADFRLGKGGSISGRVLSDKGPLAGARVALETADDDGFAVGRGVLTGADGGYLLGGVPPGRRTMIVSAAGYVLRLVSGLYVQEDRTLTGVDVTLAPGQAREFVGIGVSIGSEVEKGGARIHTVMNDSVAQAAGLQKDDVIVRIDGDEVSGLAFPDIVERIRGMEGSVVELVIRRQDQEALVRVRRAARRY